MFLPHLVRLHSKMKASAPKPPTASSVSVIPPLNPLTGTNEDDDEGGLPRATALAPGRVVLSG